MERDGRRERWRERREEDNVRESNGRLRGTVEGDSFFRTANGDAQTNTQAGTFRDVCDALC